MSSELFRFGTRESPSYRQPSIYQAFCRLLPLRLTSSPTMSFQNAIGTDARGATFTDIGGDQYIRNQTINVVQHGAKRNHSCIDIVSSSMICND